MAYSSNAAEDCFLYLREASWGDAEGEKVPVPGGPGILRMKSAGIGAGSLLDSEEEETLAEDLARR